MIETRPLHQSAPLGGLRVWRLALLVLSWRSPSRTSRTSAHRPPGLVALAASGFVMYGLLGWAGRRLAHRFEDRIGPTLLLVLYLAAMAVLFLVATLVYVAVEV